MADDVADGGVGGVPSPKSHEYCRSLSCEPEQLWTSKVTSSPTSAGVVGAMVQTTSKRMISEPVEKKLL